MLTPATGRTYTSADGLIARAGRAHEDPRAMTAKARKARADKFIRQALELNPSLSREEAIKAGQLLLRAEMARIGRLSARARARRSRQEAG